jgi:hypothetical protein
VQNSFLAFSTVHWQCQQKISLSSPFYSFKSQKFNWLPSQVIFNPIFASMKAKTLFSAQCFMVINFISYPIIVYLLCQFNFNFICSRVDGNLDTERKNLFDLFAGFERVKKLHNEKNWWKKGKKASTEIEKKLSQTSFKDEILKICIEWMTN